MPPESALERKLPTAQAGAGAVPGRAAVHGPTVVPGNGAVARRVRLEAQGTVQGVGFRPYVHRLATGLGLGGWVLNGPAGVVIEIEGPARDCDRFVRRLPAELPPLARIEALHVAAAPPLGERDFRILASAAAAQRFTLVPPDIATCPDCLAELRDPLDRRSGYPFINCTNCGPRFTLIRDLPYDRANTTMAVFAMCPDCRAEYEDPANRRFHAEPTGCPACGPRLELRDAGEVLADGLLADGLLAGGLLAGDAVERAASLLQAGKIVAVKGLGGFHLACDATDEDAVARLRRRKAREEKPFAVMVAGLAEAGRLCAISRREARLLASAHRPIVLLARLSAPRPALASALAPGLNELGLMLPYTPLHHLLLERCGRPLVMTSGNLSEEPIAYRNEEALARLGNIADAFLLHNRDIHMRCDDSVTRVWRGIPRVLRRSRGYAPQPLTLRWNFPVPLLAVGGELKNTFCLARERFAFLSHHIGDLGNESTLRSFAAAVEHYGRLFQVVPEAIVHDLHPDYLSTRYAQEQAGRVRLIGVQHHHAHIAATMAEHGLEGPVIGLAWDGTGYGTDGRLWGGEFLVCDLAGFTRAGHWSYFPLPGGAAAIRQPWRVALALLLARHGENAAGIPLGTVTRHLKELPVLARMIEKGINAPLSCGVGRLFDAASTLLTGRDEASFEGQAAIALEHLADRSELGELPLDVGRLDASCADGQWLPDSAGLIAAVAELAAAGVPAPVVAARFHNTLARVAAETCAGIAKETGIRRVAVGGGVFQNSLLLERCLTRLSRAGLETVVPQSVPANDGGLALGQAAIGGRRLCA